MEPLGVLMLDTTFPRPPGDVGHPATWPFPVLFETIPEATSAVVVRGDAASVIEPAVAAAERLAARGAVGLITSCGFLSLLQAELAARVPIPIATSSLMQIPFVALSLPADAEIGVVTYDAAALTPRHLTAIGAAPHHPIVGLPADGEFRAMIEGGRAYRAEVLEAEAVATAKALVAAHPRTKAIVLECTNLPPFAQAVRQVVRMPVYDIVTLGIWLRGGLAAHGCPQRIPAAG